MNFLIKSNLFVSFCTAALTWQTYLLFGKKTDTGIILIVFFSTLFIYCFHRLVKMFGQDEKLKSKSFLTHKRLITVTAAIAVLFLIPLLYALPFQSKAFFLMAGLLTLWYTIGIIKTKEKHLTLRRIPFLKLFLIAGIWTLMTVSLPLLDDNFKGNYWLIFFERLLFIVTITIPFDIRDMEVDRREGLKTLPLYLGINLMKRWSYVLIFLFMLVSVYGFIIGMHDLKASAALVLSGVVTLIMLNKVRSENHPFFFSLGMEGMSLLQSVLVGLAVLI